MSVQSPSPVQPATEPNAVRKRSADGDAARANEPFALPDTPARSEAEKTIEPAGANSSKNAPARKAMAAPAVANAPTATQPAEASADLVAVAAPSPTAISALLTAAIAAQAGLPADEDSEVAIAKPAAEGAEAAPAAIEATALLLAAAANLAEAAPAPGRPGEGPAAAVQGQVASALDGSGLDILPDAALVAAGAGVTAQTPNVAAVAAPAVPPASAAASDKTVASQPVVLALIGADAEQDNGKAVGATEAIVTDHSAGHTAKAGGLDPAAPAGAGDVAKPETKPIDLLQPLQNAIDLSGLAQPRSGKVDAPLALVTPDQAAMPRAQDAADGPPTPPHLVPIEIGMRALAGGRKFDIRLDPAELGRVDVSLDISENGEVKARLVVDRVETLHLLQRDARTLERAFEQAGLKPSDAGVDISLRDPSDQSGFRQNRQHDEAERRAALLPEFGDESETPARVEQSPTIRGLVRLGGVDLSI